MAVSKIVAHHNFIEEDFKIAGPISLNSDGYYDISSYIPTHQGYFRVQVGIVTWGSGQVYSTTVGGQYIIGKPSSSITNLILRALFVKEDTVDYIKDY